MKRESLRDVTKKNKDISTTASRPKSKMDEKPDFASTDIRTRTERKASAPNKYAERKATTEEEKEERKKIFRDQVEAFVTSKTEELSFPTELSSFDRMLVHEVAEAAGLLHESRGEGAERRVVIRRKAEKCQDGHRIVTKLKLKKTCSLRLHQGLKQIQGQRRRSLCCPSTILTAQLVRKMSPS